MEAYMRKRVINRKLAVAVLVAVMAAVGLVYAAWTTNGTGNAYAKAGTSQAISTVDVSASTTATLYPGVTGDVLIKLDNPNPYPVTVTAATRAAPPRA
jgi:flagellar basal body-associated protein FliL